ncbi:delta-lactam-biosynthetic de-N-acetylase [Clostridioides sp. ZZV15-6383]|uniref:delta-lactam-biosynthetic de-N-acetylase n=1 Tax=unclassified Clostridioides TaxID=2635829 RepID=UPI001D11AAFB|nr:delta-lactam-biosynthetic de-N-acetylase [Clostridioides sp. ZZV14-6345]MCC0699077.1 delta-lactam-biosynthetic de-N-acetylase [Clostridioides sp. ZZV15-6383]
MFRKVLYSLTLLSIAIFFIVGCSNSQNKQNTNQNKETQSQEDTEKIDSSKDTSNVVVSDGTDKPSKDTTNNANNKLDVSSLDNTALDWFYIPNNKHKTPEVNTDIGFKFSDYDAIYNGPTKDGQKTIYLTFDEGYENGYTPKILDILKQNQVKAVFFVTSPYIKENKDLVKRMVSEGHIVGNHSKTHPSMPTKTSNLKNFNEEFYDVERFYKDVTGKDMVKFFRPPMGKYSEKSLAMTKNLGYKTVFWSFAYRDWDTEKQPSHEEATKKIMDNLHDGSILLLHAVSKTSTEILNDFISDARKLGYEFELLKY